MQIWQNRLLPSALDKQAGLFCCSRWPSDFACLPSPASLPGGAPGWAAFCSGLFLVGDLGRADLPYIIHWNYKQKYDIDPANATNSTNPIINFLRDKPYEHRVASLPPFNVSQHLPLYDDWFDELYRIEWAQHHFPYYNIQSLDKIQMPRMPADLMAYEAALSPRSADTIPLDARHWELTNTRYLLGPAGF